MTTTTPDTSRREIHAAVLSLSIGVVLLAVKFTAYLLTDSAAIFSDALESIVNVLASGLALYSIVLAHRPADIDHPYGHGKIEFVSAGVEGGMMMVAAIVILLRAIEQLVQGAHIIESRVATGLWLIAAAMIINGIMGGYLVWRGRKSNSITLEADGKHLLTDTVTSAAVLIALLLVRLTGWRRIDPFTAMLASAWVAREAWWLIRRSAAGLMDEQDFQDDLMLRRLLDAHVGSAGSEPRICSYHKLRHRHSGRYHWIDFHLVVPAHWDIERGHRLASSIEYEIEQALGEGNATAHIEPCMTAGCEHCAVANAMT